MNRNGDPVGTQTLPTAPELQSLEAGGAAGGIDVKSKNTVPSGLGMLSNCVKGSITFCGMSLMVPVLGIVKSAVSPPETDIGTVVDEEQGLAFPLNGVFQLMQPICDPPVELTPTNVPDVLPIATIPPPGPIGIAVAKALVDPTAKATIAAMVKVKVIFESIVLLWYARAIIPLLLICAPTSRATK